VLSDTGVMTTLAFAAPTLMPLAELKASVGVVWFTPVLLTAVPAQANEPDSVTLIVLLPTAGAPESPEHIRQHSTRPVPPTTG
jgi:hypothetical protein